MRHLTLILLVIMSSACTPSLYKIVDNATWERSQGHDELQLGSFDEAFVHLAEEHQVDRIISKFFSDFNSVHILTLDAKRLRGRLVKEANPGGATEYYHLYDGGIPLKAVRETELRVLK